jgi:hypothetical protein
MKAFLSHIVYRRHFFPTLPIETFAFADVSGNSDATFDSWPKRVPHNYVPDARRAIIQAMNEHWEMFDAANIAEEEQHDEFVPCELLFVRFYTE